MLGAQLEALKTLEGAKREIGVLKTRWGRACYGESHVERKNACREKKRMLRRKERVRKNGHTQRKGTTHTKRAHTQSGHTHKGRAPHTQSGRTHRGRAPHTQSRAHTEEGRTTHTKRAHTHRERERERGGEGGRAFKSLWRSERRDANLKLNYQTN